VESALHTLREPWWLIPFDLLRIEPLLDGFPVFGVTLAGDSPPAGDLLSCFAKKEGKEGDPASPVIRLGE